MKRLGDFSNWSSIFAAAAFDAGMVTVAPAAAGEPRHGTLAVNGVELRYVHQGSGEPVLLVHHVLGDLTLWEPQRQAVVDAGYEYIAYTQRYYGADPWPDQGEHWSEDDKVADLIAVIEALGRGPVHLVTWSFSGQTGVLAALKRPDLIRSIAFYEPMFEPTVLAILPENEASEAAVGELLARLGPAFAALEGGDVETATKTFVEAVLPLPAGAFARQAPEHQAMWLQAGRVLALQPVAPPPPVTCDMLANLDVPALVVSGDKTLAFFDLIAGRVAECLPGAQRVTLAGIAHGGPSQDPEVFNALLIEFLTQH